MAKKPVDEKRAALQADMIEFAVELLTKERAISVLDFHAIMEKQFPLSSEPMRTKTGKPRKRTEGENLVDWVKARLTMRHLTRYETIGELNYILFIGEPCGWLNGGGDLFHAHQFLPLLNAIIATANEQIEELAAEIWDNPSTR